MPALFLTIASVHLGLAQQHRAALNGASQRLPADSSLTFNGATNCRLDITNDTLPAYPRGKGDSIRARRSIVQGYHLEKYKVTIGYIERDTVTSQEIIDNELLGLRVLPEDRGVVVDSFSIGWAPMGMDFWVPRLIRGNRLTGVNRKGSFSPLRWWRGRARVYFENISGHRLSDGKFLRLPPFSLWVRD